MSDHFVTSFLVIWGTWTHLINYQSWDLPDSSSSNLGNDFREETIKYGCLQRETGTGWLAAFREVLLAHTDSGVYLPNASCPMGNGGYCWECIWERERRERERERESACMTRAREKRERACGELSEQRESRCDESRDERERREAERELRWEETATRAERAREKQRARRRRAEREREEREREKRERRERAGG